MKVKVSPGFRNMGCSTLLILTVLGFIFVFYVFFVAIPISMFVSGLIGDSTIIQRVVAYSLFALYFLFVYYLMPYLKERGLKNQSDNR